MSLLSMTINVPAKPPALHIPDGFLSVSVSLVFWLVSIVCIAIALRKSRGELAERQIPLLGIMAAFIFAAQMINFPVAGGTSGHLLGGALAAIVLGPWAGLLVVASVIALQALLFQDGGLLVMGANMFNMGMLTALIAYGLYRGVSTRSRATRMAVAAVGAWLSVMASALITALQLWLSGTSPLAIVMPAMLGVHALIGVGEALITVAALSAIERSRPDLLYHNSSASSRGWFVGGVIASIAVVLISPFASGDPDGLERVAEDLGFIERGLDAPYQIIPDYTVPFLGEGAISTIAAGLIGVLVCIGLVAAWSMRGKALKRT